MMKNFVSDNGIIREMTAEETAEIEAEQAKTERIEAHRPFNINEVVKKIIPSVINLAPIDDKTALRCKEFYPTFKQCCDNKVYSEEKGYKFTDNERKNLFKTVQPKFTFVAHYPPEKSTESLYERIDETHEGTKADPIPYEGNMVLIERLYYTQDGVFYLCTRGSGQAVYNPLKDLVNLFVEVV